MPVTVTVWLVYTIINHWWSIVGKTIYMCPGNERLGYVLDATNGTFVTLWWYLITVVVNLTANHIWIIHGCKLQLVLCILVCALVYLNLWHICFFKLCVLCMARRGGWTCFHFPINFDKNNECINVQDVNDVMYLIIS